MDEFSFDASSMEALNRVLRDAALKTHTETSKALPEIGAMLAVAASEIVKPHSKSIKVSDDSVPGLAVVRGKAPNSPLARLYEKGGSRGRTKSGRQVFNSKRTKQKYTSHGLRKVASFAHPVFGNKNVWVDEERYPYLRPAASKLQKVIGARMVKAMEDGVGPIFRRM